MALALILLAIAAACGKRGNPLPPLRPVPARIEDLSARRLEDRVELAFTVPAANADGTTPVAIDRVEIYAVPVFAGAPARSLEQMLTETNRRASVAIRPPAAESGDAAGRTNAAAQSSEPAPGARAVVVDDYRAVVASAPAPVTPAGAGPGSQPGQAPAAPAGAPDASPGPSGASGAAPGVPPGTPTAVNYVAIGIAGGGRGRKGPASGIVSVPLGPPPAPPATLTIVYDEDTLTVRWPPVAGEAAVIFDASPLPAPEPGAAGAASAPATTVAERRLSPVPLASAFTEPVQFGRERCFFARSVRVSGPVTVEGPASPTTCLTPVDRYPPEAPANLQAIQEGAAVTVKWTPVDASDLAGYVVLRGDASGENMRPLMRQPMTETTFSDADVVVGSTYTYTVYAVDTAPVPNVSQQSARQVVTVRAPAR
jgi:hypothetical protein